jgi:hypothetical protein
VLAAAAPIAGSLIGRAIGPGQSQTSPNIPQDLSQSRNDSIGLMRYLLGFPGGNTPATPSSLPGGGVGGAQDYWQTGGAQGTPADRAGLFQQAQSQKDARNGNPLDSMPPWMRQQYQQNNPQFGQTTQSPLGGINGPSPQGMNAGAVNFGGMGGGQGGFGGQMLGTQPRTGGQGPNAMPQADFGGMGGIGGGMFGGQGGFGGQEGFGGPVSAPGQRIESVFGPTGMQATPLQRQSMGGISQFLNQQSPETRTLNMLQPGLQQMAGQNLETPDYLRNALAGQLAGGNPLNQQGQNLLSGMMNGANPLPQGATDALGRGLNADLLSGGVREGLMNMSRLGGGGAASGDMSALQRELGFNPGQQTAEALQPNFQRNLDAANQAGGRFGSANAILKSRAVDDYNLTLANATQQDLARRAQLANSLAANSTANASQMNQYGLGAGQNQLSAFEAMLRGQQGSGALQQGAAGLLGQFGQQGIQNQQNAAQLQGGFAQQGLQNQQGAAGLLGNLGLGYDQLSQQGQLGAGELMGRLAGQSGMNDFNRLVGGYGVGAQQAQQNDVGTSRNLGILMNQLAGMQSATLGAPTTTTPSGANQGANLGASIGQILAMFGGGGGGMNNLRGQVAPYNYFGGGGF